MKRISIIGTGFAALSAARRLRRLDRQVEITVVAPRPELVFLPSLIWIPSGLRQPGDLSVPLDKFFRENDIRFRAGEATGLENGGRTVLTSNGPIDNDGLIIACGGRFIKKLPGIEHAITPCAADRSSNSSSASTPSCGARDAATGSNWCSSTPCPTPATAWAKKRCSACSAK